jgi:hypothetical protein
MGAAGRWGREVGRDGFPRPRRNNNARPALVNTRGLDAWASVWRHRGRMCSRTRAAMMMEVIRRLPATRRWAGWPHSLAGRPLSRYP